MNNRDLSAALSVLLGGVAVTDLHQLSGGASRETWLFAADDRPLILQRQRVGDGRDMGVETAVLRVAHEHRVPVPDVIAASTDPGPLGASFMVLSHVAGETIARKILRDDIYTAARHSLTLDCALALARLHDVDPASVPALPAVDQVEQYRAVLDTLQDTGAASQLGSHPTFELVFRWLDDHRRSARRSCIVHGDFRLGNLMVGPEGLRAVLDWELAHVGDPYEDLGWLCTKAWRFGSPKPVAGVGERSELLDAYATASGTDVDVDALHWWEVLGSLKWGIMCIMQASAHLSGATRSHELAAIGRRVCENEHDLFLALDGRW